MLIWHSLWFIFSFFHFPLPSSRFTTLYMIHLAYAITTTATWNNVITIWNVSFLPQMNLQNMLHINKLFEALSSTSREIENLRRKYCFFRCKLRVRGFAWVISSKSLRRQLKIFMLKSFILWSSFEKWDYVQNTRKNKNKNESSKKTAA